MEAGRIRAPSRTVHDPSVERLVECVFDRPAVAVAVHGVRTASVAGTVQTGSGGKRAGRSSRSGEPGAHRAVRIGDHRCGITEIARRGWLVDRFSIAFDYRNSRYDDLFGPGVLLRDRFRSGETLATGQLYGQQCDDEYLNRKEYIFDNKTS